VKSIRRSEAEVHADRAERLFKKANREAEYSIASNEHLNRQQVVRSNMERLRHLRQARSSASKADQP
jgi:hypothetical protein